jgi:hypothetical protein
MLVLYMGRQVIKYNAKYDGRRNEISGKNINMLKKIYNSILKFFRFRK